MGLNSIGNNYNPNTNSGQRLNNNNNNNHKTTDNNGSGKKTNTSNTFNSGNSNTANNSKSTFDTNKNFSNNTSNTDKNTPPADPYAKTEGGTGIKSAFASLANICGTIISGGITTMKDVAKNCKEWIGNKLNYKINAMTQGSEGNCAALAAIQAIGTRADSEKILRDTIHPVTKDGKIVGYNVTFLGARKGSQPIS